jgi:hypothetical protein
MSAISAAEITDGIGSSGDQGREMAHGLLADLPEEDQEELGQAAGEISAALIDECARHVVGAVSTFTEGVVLDPGTIAAVAAAGPRWADPEQERP